MADYFFTIGIFGSKLFLIAFVLLIFFLLLSLLIQKAQGLKGNLHIESINDHFEDFEQSLKAFTLDKKGLKLERSKLKEKLKAEETSTQDTIYVIDFKGDIKAKNSDSLREEVSAILTAAKTTDEVVVRVESPGGVVHGYGFCASQLQRIRQAQIPLTVCVDMVAASGGYMMACVANQILCAPFAIIGSIGVIAQVPNFNKVLKKFDVDYHEYTAGAYKRTVSILGEITPEGESKFKDQLQETHTLFKNHIQSFRPRLDLEKLATGEYWYGSTALALGLIDKIGTSDDYLLQKRNSHKIVRVTYKEKKALGEKLSGWMGQALAELSDKILNRLEGKFQGLLDEKGEKAQALLK